MKLKNLKRIFEHKLEIYDKPDPRMKALPLQQLLS
jgi:hypothetical protein